MGSGNAEAIRLEAVMAELRDVARAKSLSRLDRTSTPTISRLLGGDQASADRLQGAIDAAIDNIVSEPHRQAATAIYGSGDDRFSALSERMRPAAGAFGVGVAAFRKRRPDTSSRFDEVTKQLAQAMLAAYATTASLSPVIPDTALQARRAGRTVGVVAAGAAAVTAVALIAILVWRTSSTDGERTGEDPAEETSADPLEGALNTQGAAIEDCDVPLGASMDPTEPPEGLIPAYVEAFEAEGSSAVLGCPEHTAELWDQIWVQELAGSAERPHGYLLYLPDGEALWVSAGLYTGYFRIGGGDGSRAQSLGGLPTSLDVADDYGVLELDGGGKVYAEYLGGLGHWVAPEQLGTWSAHGGPTGELGLPMADINFVGGKLHQDFAGGYMELQDDGSVEVTVIPTAQAEAELAMLGPVSNRIVSLYDQTAWYVDADGTRHWIETTDDWDCLGGEGNVATADIAGWILAQLPLGPTAECDAGDILDIDVDAWCETSYGEGAFAEVAAETTEWYCIIPDQPDDMPPIDLTAACRSQHNDETLEAYLAYPDNPTTWRCR